MIRQRFKQSLRPQSSTEHVRVAYEPKNRRDVGGIESSTERVPELIVAHDTPLCDLPGAPAGSKVIFQGEPILALNPTTNNLSAPSRLLRAEPVRNRYFYMLPGNLWDEVVQQVGEAAFDPEAARLEDELAAICGDHSASAGLWRGRAIAYSHLERPPPPVISAADAAEMGWGLNQAEIDSNLRVL